MTSREYWQKREEEALKHYITDEAEYKKHIDGIYDYLLDQIEKEINGFYTKYADAEGIMMAEAKKRVSKLDIEAYSRKAEKYVKNKDFSSQANAEMRLYDATMKINRLEMLKANIGLEMVDSFDELQKYFDEILTQRTLDEFERQAGILGESIKNNAKAAHSIVNASFNNATFSDRIWMYQDMLKSELSSLLAEGLIQGRNPNVLAKHLQKRFGVQKNYAERLMRTELCRVQVEAQKKSYENGGYEQYMFIATHSTRTCPVCAALDGKVFDIKSMIPATNAPPMHPNCRCSTAAWWDAEKSEKLLEKTGNSSVLELNNIEYRQPEKEDYNRMAKESKKSVSKEDIEQISGHTKADGSPGGYVATHNYSNINSNMRIDGYTGNQLDDDDFKTIDSMRKAISSYSLDDNYTMTRYVNADYLSSVFGVQTRTWSKGNLENITDSITRISNPYVVKTAIPDITKQLQAHIGECITEKSFISTSVLPNKNIMQNKSVMFKINAKKGTNCFVTSNRKESECIFADNSKLFITDVQFDEDARKWIITADIE